MPTNVVAEIGTQVLISPQPHVKFADTQGQVLYKQLVHDQLAIVAVQVLRSYASSAIPSSGQTTRVHVIVG